MLKKLLMLCVALMLSVGAAFAAVDVNTADQAALEAVKGLGPVKSKAIIDERTKNGPYKDADDLATRVKGLGTKSVANLEAEGLTIGGSSAPPSGKPAARPSTSSGKAATAPAATTATTAPEPASTPKATKASKKEKASASADAASGTAAAPTTTAASGTKATKASKKAAAAAAASASGASDAKPAESKKKDKAASSAAASQ
jgi:competence ComEA-like helix-hairpin-helix protein